MCPSSPRLPILSVTLCKVRSVFFALCLEPFCILPQSLAVEWCRAVVGGPADFRLVHGAVWSVRFVNVQLPFPFRFVLTRVSARGYPVCLQYRMSLNQTLLHLETEVVGTSQVP